MNKKSITNLNIRTTTLKSSTRKKNRRKSSLPWVGQMFLYITPKADPIIIIKKDKLFSLNHKTIVLQKIIRKQKCKQHSRRTHFHNHLSDKNLDKEHIQLNRKMNKEFKNQKGI